MEIFLGQWTRRICIGEWLIFFASWDVAGSSKKQALDRSSSAWKKIVTKTKES